MAEKVKIRWSYYPLPGFVLAKDGDGYVPFGEDEEISQD